MAGKIGDLKQVKMIQKLYGKMDMLDSFVMEKSTILKDKVENIK